MGLLQNLSKVAYNTVYPSEKIVFTQKGSYVVNTNTSNRVYDYFGSPITAKRFIIPHSYSRPVFTEALWSSDDVTYRPTGGNANTAGHVITYSDSSNIYIESADIANGTTIYYRLVCSWIDDYDTTNPSIPPFQNLPATYTQTFNSRNVTPSIIKSGVMQLSTTSATFVNVVGTVPHELGETPDPKVFFEAFSGEVWPLNYGGIGNPYYNDKDQVEAVCFANSTTLTITGILKSGNGTRRFWYLIYNEPGIRNSGGGIQSGQLPI